LPGSRRARCFRRGCKGGRQVQRRLLALYTTGARSARAAVRGAAAGDGGRGHAAAGRGACARRARLPHRGQVWRRGAARPRRAPAGGAGPHRAVLQVCAPAVRAGAYVDQPFQGVMHAYSDPDQIWRQMYSENITTPWRQLDYVVYRRQPRLQGHRPADSMPCMRAPAAHTGARRSCRWRTWARCGPRQRVAAGLGPGRESPQTLWR